MKYTIKEVHINTLKVGDTVIHNEEMLTLCKHNIGECSFMGRSIFGDSYRSGHKKVNKVIVFKAMVGVDGVVCNNCHFGGTADDLITIENEICDNGFDTEYIEACPNCKTDEYLMNK